DFIDSDIVFCYSCCLYYKEQYLAIDIDNVKNEINDYLKDSDHENNIVAENVELMESYSKISPSGNGIHIIVKGELPEGGRRKGNVEMYSDGRFFTMTGNSISRFTNVTDDELGKINYLHNKYIGSSEPNTKRNKTNEYGNDLPEDEIIRIASNSKNGLRFKLFME